VRGLVDHACAFRVPVAGVVLRAIVITSGDVPLVSASVYASARVTGCANSTSLGDADTTRRPARNDVFETVCTVMSVGAATALGGT